MARNQKLGEVGARIVSFQYDCVALVAREVKLVHTIFLMALLASSPLLTSPAVAEKPALLTNALIPDVPFVSWAEAARLEYPSKEIVNPSYAAAMAMILQYWGEDLSSLAQKDGPFPSNWFSDRGKASGLEELKPFVARGIPVAVSPTITPFADTPAPMIAALASVFGTSDLAGSGKPSGQRRSPCDQRFYFSKQQYEKLQISWANRVGFLAGVLGGMEALENFDRLKTFLRRTDMDENCVWESLFLSYRLVVGYDDERKLIYLHDASFGPAWEVNYAEFERMWEARDRSYIAAYPPNYVDRLPVPKVKEGYSPRTPNQRAAKHFVYGYALAAVGRALSAEEEIREGLSTSGIDKGYQHLLLLELSKLMGSRGNIENAISLAQQGIDLVPEHHRPWLLLAQLYRNSVLEGREQKALKAERYARDLCSDSDAQKSVKKLLGRDFFIQGCETIVRPPT